MSVNGQILGYESQWSQKMQYGVPDEYVLPAPSQPLRIYRKQVIRDVETSMPVTNLNPLIRWRFPPVGNQIVDYRRAKIYLDLQVFVDAPWSARPSNLVWNIIDRFRLEQGAQYVEDRRYFGLQETLMYIVQTHQVQKNTTGVALYGDGSDNVRASRSNGYRYCIPIPTPALTKSIIPWFQVGEKGNYSSLPDTWLQWELTAPNNFVEVFGAPVGTPITGLGYRITRMQIEYEEIIPDPMMANPNIRPLSRWLSGPGYVLRNGYPRIWWRSMLTNTYSMTQATEQTIAIDYKLSSIVALFATFRIANNVGDPTLVDKFETWLGFNQLDIIEYQWEINNCLWPDKPISLIDAGRIQAYIKFLEAFQMFHARGIQQEVTPITISQFNNDKFMCVFDGNAHPFSTNYLNPISTANSSGKIYLRVKFNALPPANVEVVVHALHWKVWNFGSRGDVPIVEV